MVKIGKTQLGKIPRIAASITDRESDKLVKSALIDIAEIRVDKFRKTNLAYVKNAIKTRSKIGVPLILTVRSKAEGGQKDIPDELKLNIFKECICLVDAVDIELNSPILADVIKIAKKNKKAAIVSWHNFKRTPQAKALKNILDKAKRSGADLIKIAVKANKPDDIDNLTRFTIENRSKNIITISLGKMGSISRLTFPGFGSLITYAYIKSPSGPGQIRLDRMREYLKLYYSK